jgi:hypothetical protein
VVLAASLVGPTKPGGRAVWTVDEPLRIRGTGRP